MNAFALTFVAFALAALAWRLWLLARHARHVSRHRDRVPPDFAALVPPEAHARAADYTRDKVRVAALEAVAIDGALLLAMSVGGGLAALDAVAASILGTGYARDLATVFAFVAVGAAASLPFDAWRTFGVEARHGFNKSTPALFAADIAKGVALAAALGTPLVLAVCWFIEATGAWWWVWAWVAWVAFTLLLVAIFPRWIAPLFNRFTPLEEGELRRRIESLVARCGFRAEGLFVMDGSRRSSHGNAYFTGFGRAKRIVFFDTLIERLTQEEIEAVLAHELGHFARGHIPRLLAVRFALAFVLLALMGWAAGEPAFAAAFGLPSPAPTGALLAAFMLAVPAFTFPFQPLASLLSRRQEFEADEFAARHASADDLVSALGKLYRDNAATLTPDPLHSLVYDSHPPAALRIEHLRRIAGRPA
ncbi:MAG: M48 family metallopeptidase [Betaproteobacteria bacterium]|nr:M48 family metallopeptidase [Betaproteobacteria bacterium]PWB67059.1 MAG: peptidase M48 [Betaproteobacteria bacterium]